MKKMMIYMLFAVAVSLWSHGQEAPKTLPKIEKVANTAGANGVTSAAEPRRVDETEEPKSKKLPEFTAEEERDMRTAQVGSLESLTAAQNAEKELNDARTRLMQSQSIQKAVWDKLVKKYDIDESKVVICDRPQPQGPCAGIPQGRIMLREKPKEAKEKK